MHYDTIMTVGELKAILSKVPDDYTVCPDDYDAYLDVENIEWYTSPNDKQLLYGYNFDDPLNKQEHIKVHA